MNQYPDSLSRIPQDVTPQNSDQVAIVLACEVTRPVRKFIENLVGSILILHLRLILSDILTFELVFINPQPPPDCAGYCPVTLDLPSPKLMRARGVAC